MYVGVCCDLLNVCVCVCVFVNGVHCNLLCVWLYNRTYVVPMIHTHVPNNDFRNPVFLRVSMSGIPPTSCSASNNCERMRSVCAVYRV